jgi:signal transduction histidine kinase
VGNEFYNYASAYKSPRGEMFFNNYAGVVAFFPQDVVKNPFIPPVVLTDFLLFNKPVPIGGTSPLQQSISVTKSLVLTHEQSIFSFEFAALSYANPDRNRYRYMLEGLEKTWNEVGSNQRLVTYTTLPAGRYTFRVQGSSGSGVWNLNGVSVDITILPPWYQTTWFRLLSMAAFLALLWAAYQYRVRQLQREFDLTLEARIGERTSIARDLHDTLLQSFHGLLLRFQTASQLLPDRPIEAKERLDSTIERAADAITEGRDAVQGLRASALQTNDLAQAVNTLGEELAADPAYQRPPAFSVTVEGEVRSLHPMLRDEIYRIAAEALRNAFRHARAQHLEVEIRYDDRQFRMRVRDDGKGMNAVFVPGQEPTGHFGLNGMRERARLAGGDLTVWSEVDAGTEVELRVPAGSAYTDSRKGSWWSRTFTEKAKD